jgi:hypothetical protein
MKKLIKTLSTAGLAATLLFSSISAVSASGVHYKDVRKSDNFYESVEYLLDQKAISRTLPTFRPYENVTRGQVASILAKVLDLKNEYNVKYKFEDVPPSHQFYPYITLVRANLLMRGYPNSSYNKYNFGVDASLTRGQFAGMVIKTYNIPLITSRNYIEHGGKVSDIFNGTKFKGTWGQHIATLEVLGYMSGFGDGKFKQHDPINRSQFANMLTKAVGSKDAESYSRLLSQFMSLGVPREVAIEKIESLKNNDIMNFVDVYESFEPVYSKNYQLAVIEVKQEGEVLFEDINVKITVTRNRDIPNKYNYEFERIEDETVQPEQSTTTT